MAAVAVKEANTMSSSPGRRMKIGEHGIHQLIVTGLIAHTCIEATVRYAAELGYEVTVVKDAAADYSVGRRPLHSRSADTPCNRDSWS
jgi:nicotinamidase-related amidase